MAALVKVSIAVIKHHGKKQTGKERVHFIFHITVYDRRKSEQEIKQDRDLEARADAEAMEGAACHVPHDFLSLLS